MTKKKQLDMWVLVIDNEGMQAPLHVFGALSDYYLCDQVGAVDKGKLKIITLDEPKRVAKAEVTLADIDVSKLPMLAPIARRLYAATVENNTSLAAALLSTRPKEVVLRNKIRQEHAEKLAVQRTVLIGQARSILKGAADGPQ